MLPHFLFTTFPPPARRFCRFVHLVGSFVFKVGRDFVLTFEGRAVEHVVLIFLRQLGNLELFRGPGGRLVLVAEEACMRPKRRGREQIKEKNEEKTE